MKNTIISALLFIAIAVSPAAGIDTASPAVIKHDIDLTFNPEVNALSAVDNMLVIPEGRYFRFLINKDFKISKIRVEGKKAKHKQFTEFDWTEFGSGFEGDDSTYFKRAKLVEVKLKKKFADYDSLKITVHYKGFLYDKVSAASFSRVNIADQTIGLIGEEGIYLSPESIYYPWAGEEMSRFAVTTHTPAEYYTVTNGKLTANEVEGDTRRMRWDGLETPTDGIYLSGAKWNLLEDEQNGVSIYGFFFPEDSALSIQFVDAVKRYLALYEGLFGKYAYPKFAVVENFFPTGYGMPSWTLLGQAVVRLPWIVNISLGHEVCHNWWGNGVFVDYKTGNWCEGITVYSADYLYKERKSPQDARSYRRNINQDYTAYVTENNDFPLTDFRSRKETYTRAIGYGKAMMVFHMLRKQIGEEDFWGALKTLYADYLFKVTSWRDLEKVFERQSGLNLNWYFRQWVEKTGSPKLTLSEVELTEHEEKNTIRLQLSVLNGDFRLHVPVVIYYSEGEETVWCDVEGGNNELSLISADMPAAIAVDPDFDVFRLLDRDEYPASLSEVLGAENQIIVIPSNTEEEKRRSYLKTAESINRTGQAKIVLDSEVKTEDLTHNSYLIFGGIRENSLYRVFTEAGLDWDEWISFTGTEGHFNLKGESFIGDDVSCMITVRNPLNRDQSVAIFSASSPAEIERTGVKLVHYGKYSYLAFERGRNKLKGNWEILDSPLKRRF